MFVVRINIGGGEEPNFKVFASKADAERRFEAARQRTHANEFESVAIFDVPGISDVREAVALVRNAERSKVTLLKLKECEKTEMRKLGDSLDLGGLDIP